MKNEINNDVLISVIAGSILLFLLCVFIVAFTLLYLKKRRQHRLEQEKLASDFAETLLQSQLEIKEETLKNIGYELHDNIGLSASLINIYLNTISVDKPRADIEKKVIEAKGVTKQLIKDIKLLSLDLNSDRVTQLGLCKVLAIEIDKLNKTNTLKANLNIIGEEFILPSATMTILYRMCQEIINNIIKHSQATEVLLELHFLENLLILVFKDNGIGFKIDEKIDGKGNGLINLHNRATVINAKFKIESTLGKGTTTTIDILK